MKLIKFQIKNYKVIDDTEPVKADPHVTALVGKNESGKTSVLKAMWKSRNVADAPFDKLYDYPRDRYSRDRKGTQEVTILEFELSPKEADDLAALLPQPPATKPKRVTYTTSYEGEDHVRQDVRFDSLDAGATGVEARAAIEALSKPVLSQSAVRTAWTTALEQIDIDGPLWEPATIQVLNSFNTAVTTWLNADPARKDVAADEREHLAKIIARAKQCDPFDKARAWAEDNLPIFIYFDDYGQLETRIHLPMYLQHKATSDPRTRTQTALFEWSRIDPQEILDLGCPPRQWRNRRASSPLS